MSNGTPKTLNVAIENGIEEYLNFKSMRLVTDITRTDQVNIIRNHVKDFISQQINKFSIDADPKIQDVAMKIWQEIIKDS